MRSNPSSLHPLGSAFTLIQLIGVLAVLAILMSVLTVSVVRRVDQGAWTRETADLTAIADSYTQAILRNRTIPAYTNMASTIAGQMSLPVSSIATNSRRFARAFLIDRNLSIGSGLPYTQTNTGTAKPANARVMIVSSLKGALPVASGNNLSDSEFNALWNTAEGAKPTTATWTNYSGTGSDLRIKKLNLEPLFYQLILINHDTTTLAKFDIDNSAILSVANSGTGTNAYYLDGTVLGLRNTTNALQTRHLMKRSISFVFDSGVWGGANQEAPPINPAALSFLISANTFVNNTLNSSAPKGASQFSVVMAMYSFMFDYTLWANECPHFNDRGNTTPPEYRVLNNAGQNSGYIDKNSLDVIFTPP